MPAAFTLPPETSTAKYRVASVGDLCGQFLRKDYSRDLLHRFEQRGTQVCDASRGAADEDPRLYAGALWFGGANESPVTRESVTSRRA